MILVGKDKIKTIHALLAKIGMANDKDYKRELIQTYTNGREESTTRLSVNEAGLLISDLQALVGMTPEQIQADRKRKRILHHAHEMLWEIDDPAGGRPKVDMDRVNAWCIKSGYLHKPLNDYTLAELSKLAWQMQKVYEDFLKAV